MTNEEAIKCLLDSIAVDCGGCYEHECDICDTQAKVMAIEALEKIDILNAELERMKEWAYSHYNRDYSTGYISCASFVQGIIAAGGGEENDE